MKKQMFGWVEIPVNDMDRAIKFYEEVFQFKISRNTMGELDMGWFPWADDHENTPGCGGSLVLHKDFYTPSKDGTLVYFQSENVNNELSRVEKAGGKVLVEKNQISEDHGYMAVFLDCEGNRLALHSKV